MSKLDTGKLAVGRPDAQVEAGYMAFMYCGGSGGGGCLTPLGLRSTKITFRIPRFVVYNRRIIFENKEFFGVRIYSDGGADGLGCPNSLGIEKPFYVALSADGNLTDAQVVAKNKQLSGALPYTIEFLAKDIPQPKEVSWGGFLFLHIVWNDATYLNAGSNPIDERSIALIKHDYDQQL